MNDDKNNKRLNELESIDDSSYDDNMYGEFTHEEEKKNVEEETAKTEIENHDTKNDKEDKSKYGEVGNTPYEYKEKEYNSGFLESHTVQTNATKMSKYVLFAFYAFVLVVGVGVFFMLRSDKYRFYLKNDEVSINNGSTYQVELIPKDSRYFDYLNYNYSIADKSIAIVDEFGTVTAVGTGTTELKISQKHGFGSKTMKIHSENIKIETIEIKADIKGKFQQKSKISMVPNESITLHSFANNRDDLNITVEYTSSNPNVATVDEFGNVSAKEEGTSVISGTKNGITSSVTIEVKRKSSSSGGSGGGSSTTPKVIESITFSPATVTIKTGSSLQLNVQVMPKDFSTQTLTWSSSGGDVTVDNKGKVTGVRKGTAVITAKSSNGVKSTCVVNVTDEEIPITNVRLVSSSASIMVGNTYQLNTNITPSNATLRNITWTSSNEKVATVSSNGLVTGKSAGSAVITAKADSGAQATANIAVRAKPTPTPTPSVHVESVDIGITQTTKYVGDKLQLTAKITPDAASGHKVTWSSNNTSIATVSNNGLVTTKKVGTVVITAKVDGKEASGTIIVKSKTSTPTPTPTGSTPTKTPTQTPTQTPQASSTFNTKYVKGSTTSITMKKGESKTFTITMTNAIGYVKAASENASIASISESEFWLESVDASKADSKTITVTGKSAGTVKINVDLSDVSTFDTVQPLTGRHTIVVVVQ